MKPFSEILKRYSLVIGIILMFALTWPIDLANSGILPIQFPFVVYLFLGWGFVFASLIMTGLTLGRDGVIALLKRFLIWRVGIRWWAFAILFGAIPAVAVLYFSNLFGGLAAPLAGLKPLSSFVPLLIILFVAAGMGEEFGWRGFAMPRLQARYNALVSSLIIGLLWGTWHIPLFLTEGTIQSQWLAEAGWIAPVGYAVFCMAWTGA